VPNFTPSACVTALQAVLETVPDIGHVYGRRKLLRTEADVKRLLLDTTNTRICGWMISPSPSNFAVNVRNPGFDRKGISGGGQVLSTLQFQVEGYFGLEDDRDSESTFRDLVWTVCDTLNGYGLLDIPNIVLQLATNCDVFGYTMLANLYFLHYTRLSIGFTGQTKP
jgi:hypothetical protein